MTLPGCVPPPGQRSPGTVRPSCLPCARPSLEEEDDNVGFETSFATLQVQSCPAKGSSRNKWFEQEVKPRLEGPAVLIRYADDVAIVCALEHDAHRVMNVIPKRLARFGLTTHPDKTKLVDFRRPPRRPGCKQPDDRHPGTFDLLGFTHFWGRSRKGNWVVQRKTAKQRFSRAVKRIAAWCRANRHRKVAEQHKILCQKLRGHDAYYGITGNSRALQRLRHEVRGIWRKWLDRRSHSRRMTWERFKPLMKRYPLPYPRIVHQWGTMT